MESVDRNIGVRFSQGYEIFSSAQRPTGFGVHSASNAMGTSGYLPMGRAAGLS